MTDKKKTEGTAIEPHVFRSVEEIDRGIGKLEKRIEELKALKVRRTVMEDSGEEDVIRSNTRETLREIFGPNSPEFKEHRYIQIVAGPLRAGMSEREFFQAKEKGKVKVQNILLGLIERLKEKRDELGQAAGPRVEDVFVKLNLHPRIAGVASDLFRDGHHWEAVFAASKALVNFVKERSNRHDLDGAPLMRTVFSRNNPILRFNELSTSTDCDEQEGLMHLFEGAVLAIRNPGGHTFPQGAPELALDYISLLSLLAHRVEQAHR